MARTIETQCHPCHCPCVRWSALHCSRFWFLRLAWEFLSCLALRECGCRIEDGWSDCGDDGQSGGIPCGESACHLRKFGDSVLMQNADCNRRAVAARAMHGQAARARDFGEALLDVVQGNVEAVRYVPGFPFAGIADIEHQGRF